MDEVKKIVRLADVGELETNLKKSLAEEEAKGKTADILYCESIEDELSDLENLPTIDPESLRPVSRWDSSGKYTFVDKKNSIAVRCEKCGCALHMREYKEYVWKFCPVCGSRMEGE